MPASSISPSPEGPNRLYYSRRVGRNPHRDNPGGATFTDSPTQATILGAAKLTGRTSNGLSVGVLAATTQEERGSAFFEGSGLTERFVVEPRTHFGVVRLQQDFNEGASTIGAIATALTRNLPADGTFDFLPNHAFNGGIDWEHQWGERTWAWFGYLAGSHVRGSEEALLRIQRSSNHRFQRPDATRLGVDSTATSMSGIDWRMTMEKRRGDHWTGSVWAAQVTKGFEVNDLGFSSRQEVLDGGFRVTYREIEPGDLLRSYNASFFSFHNWSHEALDDAFSFDSWGAAHVNGSFNLRGEVEFLNYWGLEGGFSLRPETLDRSATRGGPLMLNPALLQHDPLPGDRPQASLPLQPGGVLGLVRTGRIDRVRGERGDDVSRIVQGGDRGRAGMVELEECGPVRHDEHGVGFPGDLRLPVPVRGPGPEGAGRRDAPQRDRQSRRSASSCSPSRSCRVATT